MVISDPSFCPEPERCGRGLCYFLFTPCSVPYPDHHLRFRVASEVSPLPFPQGPADHFESRLPYSSVHPCHQHQFLCTPIRYLGVCICVNGNMKDVSMHTVDTVVHQKFFFIFFFTDGCGVPQQIQLHDAWNYDVVTSFSNNCILVQH